MVKMKSRNQMKEEEQTYSKYMQKKKTGHITHSCPFSKNYWNNCINIMKRKRSEKFVKDS